MKRIQTEFFIFVVSFFLICVSEKSYCQFRSANSDTFPVPSGVLTRPLDIAKQALANEDYPTAIEQLESLLGITDNGPFQIEDYLLFSGSESAKRQSTSKSIRKEAIKLISQMPSRGRNVFEIKHGIAAEKKLIEAIRLNRQKQLSDVSRKYFHTKAGYVATFLLGQQKLAQGDFALSTRYFRKLIEVEPARALLDPELTIQASIALGLDRQTQQAVELILSLKKNHPILTFELDGEVQSHTIVDEDSTQQFVNSLVAQFESQASQKEFFNAREWLSYRTGKQQAESIDEFPLPIPEWSVPLDGRNKQSLLDRLESLRLEKNLPSIPAMHAVALKGSVVMRTTNGVQGIDVETGKRIWKYPWSDTPVAKSGFTFERQLTSELWSGHASGTITSDGQKVYFVESNQPPDIRLNSRGTLGANPIFAGTNCLVALKVVDEKGLSVEGQLAWKIDSAKTNDGDLKNCVFLGPPLIHDDLAYVIIERGGQIRLAALDAATGKTTWTQQLASTQSKDGLEERIFRHRVSVSPVFIRGLLVCPTLVGGIVAVDLTTHNLNWGFKYPAINDPRTLNDVSSQRYPWYDDAIFVVDDMLCFSPVDSRSYYVLDIETGLLKNAEPKGKDYIVAGSFEGRLVVVGPESITLDSATGISSAKISLADFGTPTGLGFFAGQSYYLPITGRNILKVDLKEKKVVSVRSTETQMGNLLFYQGRIISQSIRRLDSFWIASSAKTVASDLLGKSNDDAVGLLLQAQLQNEQGELDDAISSTIRSVEQLQSQFSVGFLARLLVAKINKGGKLDWKKLDKGFSLLTDPVHRRTYLLAKIEAQFQAGDSSNAIEDILKLVDLYIDVSESSSDFVSVSPDLQIDGVRLIRTRLKKSVDLLPIDQRIAFVAELKNRLTISLQSDPVAKLRKIADIFGEMEFMKDSAIPVFKRLLAQKGELQYLWAHALLLDDWSRSSSEKRISLLNALIEMYLAKEDEDEPITRDRLLTAYKLLSSTIQKLSTADSAESQKLLNSVQKSIKELTPVNAAVAHDGVAKIELYENDDLSLLFFDNTGVRYESKQQYVNRIGTLPLYIGSDVNGNFDLRDMLGFTVYSDTSRSAGTRHSNSNYQHTRYQVFGDLMILSFGYDHVGLDLSKLSSTSRKLATNFSGGGLVGDDFNGADDAVLWRFDAYKYSEDIGFTKYARESNSLGLIHTELVDNNGNRIGKTTNVSDHGFCILQINSLVCVNPWNGAVHWKRSKIKPQSDMIGDGKHVFLFDPDGKVIDVLSQLDGSVVGKISVPNDMVNRVIQNGSHVVSLSEDETRVVLSGFNLNTDSVKRNWQRDLAKGTKASVLKNDNLAFLSPDGWFEIIDWRSGVSIQKLKLKMEGSFESIQIVESGRNVLLFVNKNSQDKIAAKRLEFGSRPTSTLNVDGMVFLLDEKGLKWQGPARIDGYDYVLNQPENAPVMLFRKQDKKEKATEILFLRRSDGSLIDYSTPIEVSAPTTSTRFLPNENALMFNIGFNWLKLRVTATPRPLEAPATTGKYSSRVQVANKTKEKTNRPSNDDNFLKDTTDDFQDEKKIIKNWIETEQGPSAPQIKK